LITGTQAAPKQSGLRAVSLNHVTVRVHDLQRTSQFYQEFFGMPSSSIQKRRTSWV
jgi:catechol-2,3-dioxygenase